MSDFDGVNVDKDLLNQIFSEDTEFDSEKDLMAGNQTEAVQEDIPDFLLGKEDGGMENAAAMDPIPDSAPASVEEPAENMAMMDAPVMDEAMAASTAPVDTAVSGDSMIPEDIPSPSDIVTPADLMGGSVPAMPDRPADDETTVITKGTTINGGVSSDGSLEIMGTITGDVECLGKLSVSGCISGNVAASDVVVNTKNLVGNIASKGSVEVMVGTVIVGDITGTSATVAGAVKGNIDVNGPVIVDSTAIVKGSIKAKTIQVNTGAVVDGYCSLNYAGVDVDEFFDEKESEGVQ